MYHKDKDHDGMMLSSPPHDNNNRNNYISNMVKSIIPSVRQAHPACASSCSSPPQEPLPSPTATTTTRNKRRELSFPLSRSDRNVRSRCWQTNLLGHQSWTTAVAAVSLCLFLTVAPATVVESFVPGNNNCFFGASQSLPQLHHQNVQQATTTATTIPTKAKNKRGRIMTFVANKDDNDIQAGGDDDYDGLGNYDPSEGIRPEREVVVGDPQLRVKEKERSVTAILKELAAIQQQGPQKYCILGTRHCSYLHQQIIELL